jgi:mannosylglucosylglycerate synthase
VPTKTVALLHYAAPPVVGGVESTIEHHARLLAGAGYAVQIITGAGKPFDAGVGMHVVPEFGSSHPEVLSVTRELAAGGASRAFSTLTGQLVTALRDLLRHIHVCIVHNALTLHKNLPLTAALHRLNEEKVAPLIAWCHDFAWEDQLYAADLHPGYPWDLLRTPWPGVRYVVVSEHRRLRLAELLGLDPEDIRVINPGVDAAEFLKLEPLTRRLVAELDLLRAAPLMLLPARITRRKNIEFGLHVTAALSKRMPKAALVVTGPPGPHNPANADYLDRLRTLRHDLGLAGSVHFLYEHGENGQPLHVTDAMMSDFYQLADLLLFPSRYEGFGIPVLEAGLARLPVFASDIPPVRESAGDWVRRFAPDSDPADVAASIADVLASCRPFQLRRRVLEHYTWQAKVCDELIPLIEEGMGDG